MKHILDDSDRENVVKAAATYDALPISDRIAIVNGTSTYLDFYHYMQDQGILNSDQYNYMLHIYYKPEPTGAPDDVSFLMNLPFIDSTRKEQIGPLIEQYQSLPLSQRWQTGEVMTLFDYLADKNILTTEEVRQAADQYWSSSIPLWRNHEQEVRVDEYENQGSIDIL